MHTSVIFEGKISSQVPFTARTSRMFQLQHIVDSDMSVTKNGFKKQLPLMISRDQISIIKI